MPQLKISLSKIKDNIDSLLAETSNLGFDVVGVIKPFQEFRPLVELYDRSGFVSLGVSRTDAARRLRGHVTKPLMLTCVPRPEAAHDVVMYCDASLNSEIETIYKLSEYTKSLKRSHSVILMIEIGDLREGVLPENVVETVSEILRLSDTGLRFGGIGVNYGCVNGVIPTDKNMALIASILEDLKVELGVIPDVVSLGGSVVLEWAEKNGIPSFVTQIRVGEPLLLGNLSGSLKRYKNFHQDALEFEATIVEIKMKPSFAPGEKTADAFGIKQEQTDRGIRERALLDFGVVDTDPPSLNVVVEGLEIITSNSDYTVVDLTDCTERHRVGDVLSFHVTYKAMLQCFTNERLRKTVSNTASLVHEPDPQTVQTIGV